MGDSALSVRIVVKTDARKEYIRENTKGGLDIAVQEPAQDNRANERICQLIAVYYHVPQKAVKIVAGHHRSHKSVKVGL